MTTFSELEYQKLMKTLQQNIADNFKSPLGQFIIHLDKCQGLHTLGPDVLNAKSFETDETVYQVLTRLYGKDNIDAVWGSKAPSENLMGDNTISAEDFVMSLFDHSFLENELFENNQTLVDVCNKLENMASSMYAFDVFNQSSLYEDGSVSVLPKWDELDDSRKQPYLELAHAALDAIDDIPSLDTVLYHQLQKVDNENEPSVLATYVVDTQSGTYFLTDSTLVVSIDESNIDFWNNLIDQGDDLAIIQYAKENGITICDIVDDALQDIQEFNTQITKNRQSRHHWISDYLDWL